jgi:hypothetical protein
VATPIRDQPSGAPPREAGLRDYLKEAFFFRWNLLFLLGGAAAAALTPLAPALLPLVAAGELAYLAGLVSVPRFRAAIDAKAHAERGATGGRRRSACAEPAGMLEACRKTDGHGSNACTRAASNCAASRPASAAPRATRPVGPKRCARQDSTGCSGCFSACCCRRPPSTGSSRR